MIDYPTILSRRFKGEEWILEGDEYSGLIWLSDSIKPTKKQLDDLWESVKEEIAAEAAAREALRSSALTKLGLTADEISVLFG